MPKFFHRLLLPLPFLALVATSVPAGAVDLKIATVLPANSAWMVAMRQGSEEIRQRTDGRVNLKFFAGGVMGNDQSVLRKIRIGQLQGGAFTSGGLGSVCPDLGLYSFPLLFRSPEEVEFVRSRRDASLTKKLKQAGFVSYGFAQGGFAMLMSDLPVHSLADLRGQKIWVPEGDVISYRTMETLGLAPVSLPITDVMTGLQTDLVNIVASSPVGAVAFQWYTRVKYFTDVPISFIYGTLAIDRKAVERLLPEDQQVLGEVMTRLYHDYDAKNRKDNLAARQAMVRQGLTVIAPQPAEVQEWREKTAALARQLRDEGLFNRDLFDEIEQDLEEFRSGRMGLAANRK